MEKLPKGLAYAYLVTAAFTLILVGCDKPPATSVSNPSLTPSLNPVQTPSTSIRVTDSTNDLFDGSGESIDGEPYLDIVETELSSFDTYYLATIKLNQALPSKLDDSSLFIEWDFFVDADSNPVTGWNNTLLFNDIGPDYLFRLSLSGSKYTVETLDIKANKFSQRDYRVNGTVIELRLPKVTLQSDSFNYITVVNKDRGGGTELLIADKAPNQGHGQFP